MKEIMEKISYTHNSAHSYFDQKQNVPITASSQNYGDLKPDENSISLGTMPCIYDSLFLIGDCNKYDIIKGIPSHNNPETEVEGDFINEKSELSVKEIRLEGNPSVNQVSCTSNNEEPEREKCLDYRTMSDRLISGCSSVFMQRDQSLEMPFKASTNLVYSDSTNITTKSFSCPETDNWSERREIEQIKFREIVNGKGRLSSIILASNDKKSNEDSELIEIPYKISLSDERGSLSVNVTDKKVLDYLKTIHVSNRDATKDHLSECRPESDDTDKWNKFLKPYKSYRFYNCGEEIDKSYEKIVNDNLFSCKSLNDDSQQIDHQTLEDKEEKNNSISKDVHSMLDNDSSGSSAFESAFSSNDTLSILSLSRNSSKISSVSNPTGKNFNLSTLTSENIPVAMSKMQTQQSVTEKIQPEPESQVVESQDNQDTDSITSPRRYRSIIKLLNLTSHKKKNNQSCEFVNKKREKHFDHPSFKKRLSSRLGSNHTDKLLIQDDTINTKSEIHENIKSALHDGIISDKTGCETAIDCRTLVENPVTKKAKRKIQFISKNGLPSQSQPNSCSLDRTKKFISKIPRPVSKKESISHEKNGKVIHKTTNQKPTDPKTIGLKTIDNVSKVNDKQEGRIKPKFAFKFGDHKNTSKEKPSSKNRKDNSLDLTNRTAFSERLNDISISHETPQPSNCLDMRDRPAESKSTLASKKCSRGIVSNSSIIRSKYWKKELKKNSYSFIDTNMPSILVSSVKQQAAVKPDDHHSVKVYNRDYGSTSYGTTYGKMNRVKTAPGRPNNKIYKKRSLDMNLHVPDLVLR